MAFTPDEMAGLMPPLTLPGTPAPQSAALVPPAQDLDGRRSELLRRLENSGRRMANTPTVFGMPAIPGIAPPGREPTSFQRAGVEQLSTAPNPDVPVQQAAPLDRATAFRQAIMGGGTGGLGQLRADWQGARQKLLGGYDAERDLAGRKGVAQADRTDAVSDLVQLDAAKKQRDAQLQAQQDEAATAKHQQFLARNTELADDVGRQKVDPRRLLSNRTVADKAMGVLDGMLGGFVAGLKGGPNEALQRFDKKIAEDIDSQQNAIDNKKASLSARQGIFGQMLQETGDRRLAAMQTRNLMYEAAKQELGAEADRLGIPEVLANADIAKQAIQGQQDKLNEQFKHESFATAQAQAAAAASAQRAAEERAWNRQMEVAKLGLERDKLSVEQAKALGLTPDDLAKQTQALGKELSDKDLAEGRAGVEAIKRRLESAAPNEGLPGVGKMADFRAALKPDGATQLLPGVQALNAVAGLSDEERVSRNDWNKLKLTYQKQITGSGASTEERKMLSDAFEGAKSPMEQRAAIEQADAYFRTREGAIRAGFDPRAVSAFDARLKAFNPQLPNSVRVKR